MSIDLATIKNLPNKPGVYRFYNSGGVVLYIGKAKNLKNRVSSYFQDGKAKNQRITLMISQADRLEYTVVNSEKESLILEANLIHNLQPKYNVLLKDDKNYVYVRITNDEIPGIFLTRRKYDSLSNYYGPYTKKSGIQQTISTLRPLFPFCQEKSPKSKPCQYVGIKQCDGICVGRENKIEYNEKIKQISSILEGKTEEVEIWIAQKIQNAVSLGNYELAALWRDRLANLKATIGTQKIILPHPQDLDIVTLVVKQDVEGLQIGSIFLQSLRGGKVNNVSNFILMGTEEMVENGSDNQVLKSNKIIETIVMAFLTRFFASFIPGNADITPVLLQTWYQADYLIPGDTRSRIEEGKLEWKRFFLNSESKENLEMLSGVKIYLKNFFEINHNEILSLQEQAKENAILYLHRNQLGQKLNLFEENNLFTTLVEIKEKLNLKKIPRRIECYDISHLSGTFAYGSMVTFVDGRPANKLYRLFRVKDKNDDFENQQEVMRRRIQRYVQSLAKQDNIDKGWNPPDLIIIDGGKGQLSSVLDVITHENHIIDSKNTCFDVEICSLAKKEELVFLPQMSEPVRLEGSAKFMFQRIRDEAHRFAITNNRKSRLKSIESSKLDAVVGIGSKTKQKLLTRFGSTENVVANLDTNPELLHELVGKNIVSKLKKHFGFG